MKVSTLVFIANFLYIVIVFLVLYGWFWNIIKIVHFDFNHFSGMIIARIIGVFLAPLGALLGYF